MSAFAASPPQIGVPVIQQVRSRIHQCLDGQPISGAALADIADRKIVENTLRTLASRGEIVRIIPGYFSKPLPVGFEDRRRAIIGLVTGALAHTGHIAVTDGPTAAFELGLIPQPPILATFLTTATERTIDLGRVRVTFLHAEPWWFVMHDCAAGQVIRALGWAGPSRVTEAWSLLRSRLAVDVIEALQAGANRLPRWMASTVAHGE